MSRSRVRSGPCVGLTAGASAAARSLRRRLDARVSAPETRRPEPLLQGAALDQPSKSVFASQLTESQSR
jgi:hypothetical protein